MAGGRPPKKIDWEELDRLCSLRLSEDDIEDQLKVSVDTLSRKIRIKFGLSFAEYRTKKMSKTRARLAQKALDLADAGCIPMLIFCLKNFNNWSDKSEIAIDRLPEPFIIERLNGAQEILGAKAGSGAKLLSLDREKEDP